MGSLAARRTLATYSAVSAGRSLVAVAPSDCRERRGSHGPPATTSPGTDLVPPWAIYGNGSGGQPDGFDIAQTTRATTPRLLISSPAAFVANQRVGHRPWLQLQRHLDEWRHDARRPRQRRTGGIGPLARRPRDRAALSKRGLRGWRICHANLARSCPGRWQRHTAR